MEDLTEAALEKAVATGAYDKKPPRKPRPSELAKKKAKAQKKKPKAKAAPKRKPSKPAKSKTKPTKAKKAPAKKAKAAKKPAAKSKAPKKSAKAAAARPLVRTCRIDVRLLPAEKNKLKAAAKRERRTITGVLQGLIAKLK